MVWRTRTAYLLPAASAILDGMAGFDFDLLRKNGRAGLIAARVVGVDALENRGDSRSDPDALAPKPGGKIGRGGRGWGIVLVCPHMLLVAVLLLLLGGHHDEMMGWRSTRGGSGWPLMRKAANFCQEPETTTKVR